jgi:signal transduction histidine kinase/ActR/RegA family two-component response regulator
MAETLEQREAERKNAAALLESRVAARTRELSETNNRLQVEISEREKTEAALAQAQKLQAVGRLAGGIAHDFNNLLATILGNLELMERRVGEHDDRLLALIRRASSAVSRGAQLTARLLAFSRRHRPIVQPTDVNKLITDLLTLASSTLGRRITVQSNLAPNLWPALIDANQVEAAILNLALNARDAMPGGGTLTFSTANETVEIARDGLAPGDYVRVDVTDTGTGMSEEVMRRAFEPFFTTKGPGGSGLGLSQVYGVANQTGGGVRIRSAPGAGTTVSMLLPRAVADADLIGAPRQRRRIEGAPRVLLIDDDRPVRQATAEMLRDLGCDVVEAPAGEEGLDILHAEGARIGLMIVDYAMPGLNGLEVAVRVRRMARRVPILIVTGYAELDDSSGPGFDAIAGVLHKPFTINELETAITRAIAAPVHI